jgi:hypothetical protein
MPELAEMPVHIAGAQRYRLQAGRHGLLRRPEDFTEREVQAEEREAMTTKPVGGRYRKKPVVIDAAQWFKNGDHPLDYSKDHDGFENDEMRVFTAAERKERNWEGDIVRYFRLPNVSGSRGCHHCSNAMQFHGWIDTKEGGHIVCPGDWIITGVKGEFYPCKPDIFAETYEEVQS